MHYFHCGLSGQDRNKRINEKKKQQQQQHENELVKGKYANIYACVIYTHPQTDNRINTDTHIHINTCVIQVR